MSSDLTKRTDMDFLSRSFPGLFVYATVWPLLAFAADFFSINYNLAVTFTALFIGISVVRVAHAYSTPYFYAISPSIWRIALFSLAFSHALTLSSIHVYLIVIDENFNMVILTTLIMVGLVGGAASSLAPKPIFTQFYIAVILCPTMIAYFFSPSYHFLAPLVVVMWIYYILMCRRYYKEYTRAFDIERKLKENQIKLEALNQTDTLTGIYNRQYFDNALDLQWDLASRSQSSLSILFLDLDFFKKVNDEYGHIIGDKALCHAASVFQETAKRKSDMVARYGGEEFAIILPSTQHDIAKELAENIRLNIEKTPLIYGEITVQLTVSIGVNYTIPNNQINCILFLDQVDQALYEAKHTGRNCVVSYLDMQGSIKS
jgi:diguanylate cyclase (GGDEF)-like protein